MSAIGTKRTSLGAWHMSAFDPKRTLALALHISASNPRGDIRHIWLAYSRRKPGSCKKILSTAPIQS